MSGMATRSVCARRYCAGANPALAARSKHFAAAFRSIKTRLGAPAVAVQLPLGQEADLHGVIDLINMKAMRFKDDTLGAEWTEEDIPEEFRAEVEEARATLLEAVAEVDDVLMERYLEGDTDFSPDEIVRGIRSFWMRW